MKPPPFSYQLIRSTRRTVAIQVKPDGTVIVRAPNQMPTVSIKTFLQEKSDWIENARARMRVRAEQRTRASAEPGRTLWYLGQAYPVVLQQCRDEPVWDGQAFALPPSEGTAAATAFFIRQAEALLPVRVRAYAEKANLPVPILTIGCARSRWGSCSADNRLRFSWRLLCAPPAAVDYVAVHELAHIRHHNHSPAFWREVERIWPGWKTGADSLRAFERAVDLSHL